MLLRSDIITANLLCSLLQSDQHSDNRTCSAPTRIMETLIQMGWNASAASTYVSLDQTYNSRTTCNWVWTRWNGFVGNASHRFTSTGVPVAAHLHNAVNCHFVWNRCTCTRRVWTTRQEIRYVLKWKFCITYLFRSCCGYEIFSSARLPQSAKFPRFLSTPKYRIKSFCK